MIAVRMVQMAIDEIIDVIAVRDRFMAAIGAMDVTRRMSAACMRRSAVGRILVRHVESVLLDIASLGMMQVAVV